MRNAATLVSSDERIAAHNVLKEIGIEFHQRLDNQDGLINSSLEFCDVTCTVMDASVSLLERGIK